MHINRETSTEMSDHGERADVVVSNVPSPSPPPRTKLPSSILVGLVRPFSLFTRHISTALLFQFQHTAPTTIPR